MRRNRILYYSDEKEFQYINIPVKKHNQKTIINQIEVNNDAPWRDEIIKRLAVYKKLNAGFYPKVMNLVSDVIDKENKSLVEIMMNSFNAINSYLDLETKYMLSSAVDYNRDKINAPDEWALCVTEALGGNQYINPPGGANLYESEKFRRKGIELLFLMPKMREYPQNVKTFIPGLSIIDVLMFNSPEKVREMLRLDFTVNTIDANTSFMSK